MSSIDEQPYRLRADFKEALVLGARTDYQIGFTPRELDTVLSAALEVVTEEGEPVLDPGLDLTDLAESEDAGTWLITVYPSAPGGRGSYWIEATFTTALGLIHKRFVRLRVI